MHRFLPKRLSLSALLLLLASCCWFFPTLQRELNEELQAAWLALERAKPHVATPITLVALDEAAIDTIGPWPWSRETWAELLRRLQAQHQPAVVALDVVFPSDPKQAAGNQQFGEQLRANPSVIGQLLLPEPTQRGAMHWTPIQLTDPADLPRAAAAATGFAGTLGNDPAIAATEPAGHINAQIDPDGVMRHLPTLLCLNPPMTQCSISLFQAITGRLIGTTTWELQRGQWWQAPWLLMPPGFPQLALPLDAQLQSLIPWRHPSGLNYVSASSIWAQSLPPEALSHQVLIFGGVSLGLGDIATSPLARTVPGMEVHGQLLRDWLLGQLPYEPRGGKALAILLAALAGYLLLLQAHNSRALWILGLAIPSTLLAGGTALWWWAHIALPIATPAAFTFTVALLLLIRHTLRERQEIASRISPYLPEPLRRLLGSSHASVHNETGWGTIMVADILGYTRQSHRLPLDQLAHWCDQGVDLIIRHAHQHGGFVDTVAGDGALLLWRHGSKEEQAQAACAAAKAIIAELPQLNLRLAQAGLPSLAIGVGLHAGPYLLGSFGHGQKRYTIVSEAANIAAHIERETRHHPWALLLSKTIAESLPSDASLCVAALEQEPGHDLPLYTLQPTQAYHWPSLNTPSPSTAHPTHL